MSAIVGSSNSAMEHAMGDRALVKRIRNAKVLLVGAGGIGCEVIKTLLLLGFTEVDMIDLDTIDVSNLNRQFLFNKSHVQKSKSLIASQVAIERFAHRDVVVEGKQKTVEVRPICGPIQQREFDVNWFRSYTMVLNALDNRAARSHVNRMCLAADVPLIESGSQGYMGQAYVIKKGVSMCYDCEGPRKDEQTFASCTIRNTPSQPIHCIVWAKHLFAQLFGEHDADNDVSPDSNDPELQQTSNNGEGATVAETKLTTREWAQEIGYDCRELFSKFFERDIEYLLSMDKLWEKRKKPVAVKLEDLLQDRIVEATSSSSQQTENDAGLKDQVLWTLKQCYEMFEQSVKNLSAQLTADHQFLVWDKDDEDALNFVTAVSNFRSHCFAINRKSRFDVKSMAGNIIPAISSTNSVVGGFVGLQALQVLQAMPHEKKEMTDEEKEAFHAALFKTCRYTYLRKVSSTVPGLISGFELERPRKSCMVCNVDRPEVEITCKLDKFSLIEFVEQIIISKLHFVCPDITVQGTTILLYSKDDADEEEDKSIFQRKLSEYSQVGHGTRLEINDLIQDQKIVITLVDGEVDPKDNDGYLYSLKVISGHVSEEAEEAEEDAVVCTTNNGAEPLPLPTSLKEIESVQVVDLENGDEQVAPTNGHNNSIDTVYLVEDDSNDVICLSDDDSKDAPKLPEKKRPAPNDNEFAEPTKRQRSS